MDKEPCILWGLDPLWKGTILGGLSDPSTMGTLRCRLRCKMDNSIRRVGADVTSNFPRREKSAPAMQPVIKIL